MTEPLLVADGVTKIYPGGRTGCHDVSFSLYQGEVLGIVGESGSGKSTLLNCLSAKLEPTAGCISFDTRNSGMTDIFKLSEPERRLLMRTDCGIVHQNPRDGLRMGVSAGGNLGERLMVMKGGEVVESGLTDQVLDDPYHPTPNSSFPPYYRFRPVSQSPVLQVENLAKTFTLHTQGGVRLPVFRDVSFTVSSSECVVLSGPSGNGKSTLLHSLYANYLPDAGHIRVKHGEEWVDMVTAEPREILAVRRETMGYVSQFLRVIPRVPALDIVAEPLLAQGVDDETAKAKASDLLARLALPERLWSVPPATFSGGEQQRVNIARSFVRSYPVMLLDEPTASLDAANRDTVVVLINEARNAGSAIVAICHDAPVRDAIATRLFDVTEFQAAP